MGIVFSQIDSIQETIRGMVRQNLHATRPGMSRRASQSPIIWFERSALFAFLDSISVNLGVSVYEAIARDIAGNRFTNVSTQYSVGNAISEDAKKDIEIIIKELTTGNTPNKINEIRRIRKACYGGKKVSLKTAKADLFLQDNDGVVHLFSIKTVKPRFSDIKRYKKTILDWIGVYLSRCPDAEIKTYITFPYNLFAPQYFERWIMTGMLDLDHELKVAEEFWDFLGGQGTYEVLLDCFERAGVELRPELDQYFQQFR